MVYQSVNICDPSLLLVDDSCADSCLAFLGIGWENALKWLYSLHIQVLHIQKMYFLWVFKSPPLAAETAFMSKIYSFGHEQMDCFV